MKNKKNRHKPPAARGRARRVAVASALMLAADKLSECDAQNKAIIAQREFMRRIRVEKKSVSALDFEGRRLYKLPGLPSMDADYKMREGLPRVDEPDGLKLF